MIHAFHGNLGSASDWDDLNLPDLVAHDLWSDLEAEPELTLEAWGRHFATRIDDSHPVLLGYSLGGRLALHAMTASSGKWAGAVIVSAHPGLDDDASRRARCATDGEWAEKARHLEWETFLAAWNDQPALERAHPAPSQMELEIRRESIALAFENWSLGRQQHLGDHLGGCHFPVLWVTGSRDEKFTALAAGLKCVIPNFEHAIIPDCGHRVPFEKPDELAATVRDFVDRRC